MCKSKKLKGDVAPSLLLGFLPPGMAKRDIPFSSLSIG
tara:strand:- start:150 stop:263 length:114 start_codon:yes stop_codon:yes gene_type:complete